MKRKIKIVRLYQTPIGNPKQTEGELYVYDGDKMVFECKTLELPWKNNANQISCIDDGIYTGVKRLTPSSQFKYEHIHIKNVANRKWILIHAGNYSRQVLGCILVGDKLTDIDGDGLRDVTNSRKTLEKLLTFLDDEFDIEIVWR